MAGLDRMYDSCGFIQQYIKQQIRELYQGVVTASLPPLVDVKCLNCDYKGYRYLYPITYRENEIKKSEEDYIIRLRELIEEYGDDSEVFYIKYQNLLREIIEKKLSFKRFFEVLDWEHKES